MQNIDIPNQKYREYKGIYLNFLNALPAVVDSKLSEMEDDNPEKEMYNKLKTKICQKWSAMQIT